MRFSAAGQVLCKGKVRPIPRKIPEVTSTGCLKVTLVSSRPLPFRGSNSVKMYCFRSGLSSPKTHRWRGPGTFQPIDTFSLQHHLRWPTRCRHSHNASLPPGNILEVENQVTIRAQNRIMLIARPSDDRFGGLLIERLFEDILLAVAIGMEKDRFAVLRPCVGTSLRSSSVSRRGFFNRRPLASHSPTKTSAFSDNFKKVSRFPSVVPLKTAA